MAPIRVRGNTLDPASLKDDTLSPKSSDTEYALVQLNREMDAATLEALETQGAEVVKRMVDNNWLLLYRPSDLGILEANVPAVNYAMVYPNLFVVHQKLKGGLESSSTTSEENVDVAIVLHENARANANEILATIQAQYNVELLMSYGGTFHINVNRRDLDQIATLDAIQAIELITPAKAHNDRFKAISGVDTVNNLQHSTGKPILTGSGQVVTVTDTGVDVAHPALKDKIIDSYYVKGAPVDEAGHGTHVAGIVAGSPMQDWAGLDSSGVAPNARLFVQGGIFRRNAASRWTAPMMFDMAYTKPNMECRIHNNSWGYFYGGDPKENLAQAPYTIDDAEAVDKFAIDHPDYFIVYSAGNDGQLVTKTAAQIGAWAAAKNVLTVGATYTDRPFSGDDIVDYSPENVAIFKSSRGTVAALSSRGPVKGTQRTKPDVVAPGMGILSARSGDAVQALSSAAKKYGQPLGGYKPTDNTVFMSGTSMAAPAVSGCAALVREALQKWQGIANPSAPLLKALFINGTTVLPQASKNAQGFGEIDMVKVLRPVSVVFEDMRDCKTSSGWFQLISRKDEPMTPQTFQIVAPAAANGKTSTLKVTLVYHDWPGDQIQNRMNLYVDRQGTRTETLPKTPFDNVHQLIFDSLGPKETITIGVEAKLIIQGSLPWAVVWDCYE